MARKREKWPLQLSLSKAVRMIAKIYSSYGRSVNAELAAPILECKRKSSNFSKRVIALSEFRLATYSKDVITLTPLALTISAPVSNTERNAGILEAFNNIELLNGLLARFPGGHLPTRENIKNLLMREHAIPKETADKWCEFVEESFQVINQIPTGEPVQKLELPNTTKIIEQPNTSEMQYDTKISIETIRIPLKKGKGREIVIPTDLDMEELNWFHRWFELWGDRPE